MTVTVRPAAARALAAAAPAGPEPITSHDPAALVEGRSSAGPVNGSEMGHRGTWKIHQRTTVTAACAPGEPPHPAGSTSGSLPDLEGHEQICIPRVQRGERKAMNDEFVIGERTLDHPAQGRDLVRVVAGIHDPSLKL